MNTHMQARKLQIFAYISIVALSTLAYTQEPTRLPAESEQQLVASKDFKGAIQEIDRLLQTETTEQKRGFLLVEKAKLLFADQQQMEACDVFLGALSHVNVEREEVSTGEVSAFQSLFPVYEASLRCAEDCEKLIQQAENLLQAHPDYVSMELYVAAGLANMGSMVSFFERFFHAFQHRSDSFLAWKTRGVLHLRLYEASPGNEERSLHRTEAVHCFQEAFRKQPQDSLLLIKILFIMPVEEKRPFLEQVVDDFIQLNIPPKRTDCFFLIEQALDIGARDAAKKLIDKARIWYQYSRALNDLSERFLRGGLRCD